MIISKIVGGLGNQLFCYAAGKALAERLNFPFKIDIREYENYKVRPYALNYFDIRAPIAEETDFSTSSIYKKILRLLSRSTPSLYQEKSLEFDENILKISRPTYLSGYWQCEKYFTSISSIIRKEFTFRESPNEINQEYLEKIKNSTSVSVHIRRGDYVSNPAANAVHGLCNLAYYQKAAAFLLSRLNDRELTFYVFSDDPDWVRENLILHGKMVYVSHNNAIQNHEDLRLMAACQHHIIANSSFSWWSAWLNPSPDKIVIAPQQWFKDKRYSSRDIIPASWIRL